LEGALYEIPAFALLRRQALQRRASWNDKGGRMGMTKGKEWE